MTVTLTLRLQPNSWRVSRTVVLKTSSLTRGATQTQISGTLALLPYTRSIWS